MTRAVVFDLGAVLFQWQPLQLLQQCVPELAADEERARTLAAQIFESLTPDSDWARFDLGLIAEADLALRIAGRTGVPSASIHRVIDAIPSHLQPQAPTLALLRHLQARGYRLYYLSNMPRPYADHLERCNAFMADFADGIFSCRVGLMKPHAAIFALAERRFGIDPANTLFIDDHADNVAAARRRSWQALQFAEAGQCSAEMQALGW